MLHYTGSSNAIVANPRHLDKPPQEQKEGALRRSSNFPSQTSGVDVTTSHETKDSAEFESLWKLSLKFIQRI